MLTKLNKDSQVFSLLNHFRMNNGSEALQEKDTSF